MRLPYYRAVQPLPPPLAPVLPIMSSASHRSPHPFPTLLSVEDTQLPQIRSERIRDRIFTHSSLAVRPRYDFQAPESDPSADNEELAHIGDQVFGLALTDLIQRLYPQLQVGPATKMRDCVLRKSVLAEICVSYGLHKRLNLLERHAKTLRDSQEVRVNTLKAYVGGLYQDQGFEVVSKWLASLFRFRVEAAYQKVRRDYDILSPVSAASPEPGTPGICYPSPSSTSSSDGNRPAPPDNHTEAPSRGPPSQANESEQRSWQANNSLVTLSAEINRGQFDRKRRRGPSSPTDGRRGDTADSLSSAPGIPSQRLSTGSDPTERARKRPKSGQADAGP
ncbi:ribonuclease III domain-containing protein [Russula earlei]|uniref:Ribonuclease III domain-containing protein n=1 Tax=Russula earlei TaxID=71964 RepID=A0ACC0TTG4_9AGAM|nr:ribonuclease III domain-containing protein [Russula earlei]